MKNWTTVELLRQSRHDWLNKIQIIKGNIELNKIDRVKGLIDEIIVESNQEARLSNLNLPKFSELMMTANWNNWTFDTEYEVIDLVEGFEAIDELMYQWTKAFFELLEEQLDPIAENMLTFHICKKDEIDLRCSFHITGAIKNQEALRSFLAASLTKEQKIHELICTEEELYFKMDVKFE